MTKIEQPINRRRFFKRLGVACASALVLGTADARFLEPHWLKIRRLRIASGTPVCRFAYFTDLHYKGDRACVQSVVDAINAQSPDFVCFGGDLVESWAQVKGALDLLSGIKAPLYGVPGNHDCWSNIGYESYRQCFAAKGGRWLMNEHLDLAGGRLRLIGLNCHQFVPQLPLNPQAKNILLTHYPAWADQFNGQVCDLMLAGHSHGGQVRLPVIGPLILPEYVGHYDLGLFQSPVGPLYVNPGIGWYQINARFNCRPEITIIEV